MTISINIKAKKRMEQIKLLAVCVLDGGSFSLMLPAKSNSTPHPITATLRIQMASQKKNGEEDGDEEDEVSAFPAE